MNLPNHMKMEVIESLGLGGPKKKSKRKKRKGKKSKKAKVHKIHRIDELPN